MYLLSDNSLADFAAWVQAGCALITLMLVIMGLLQNRRIQELTDIVKELSNQTTELKAQSEVLIKRYELEMLLSTKSRMPMFEMRYFYITETTTYTLSIVNKGITAIDVRVFDSKWKEIFIKSVSFDSDGPDIKEGSEMLFRIHCTEQSVRKELLSFSLTLKFGDVRGNKFIQLLTCEEGVVRIKPSEIIEN